MRPTQKISILVIISLLIIMIITHYRDVLGDRQINRINYYNMAKAKSIETNKPLLIIGDPDTGSPISRFYSVFYTYGYGNACIDLSGCPGAPNTTKKIKGNVENEIVKFKDNSCVIFVCVVLEYVDNIEFVLKELYRVSGGDIYVVYGKNMHKKYKDGNTWFKLKNKILKAPPKYDYFEWERL